MSISTAIPIMNHLADLINSSSVLFSFIASKFACKCMKFLNYQAYCKRMYYRNRHPYRYHFRGRPRSCGRCFWYGQGKFIYYTCSKHCICPYPLERRSCFTPRKEVIQLSLF